MAHKMSSCVNPQELGAVPRFACVFSLVVFVCFVLFCFVCFLFGCSCVFVLFLFDGTACWTMYRSIISSLLWLSASRRPCMRIYKFSFYAEIERVKRPGESHEGVGRKKNHKGEVLHSEVLGNGPFRGHDELALTPFSRVDIEFRL